MAAAGTGNGDALGGLPSGFLIRGAIALVSDATAVMMMGEDRAGEVIEFGPTQAIFTNPQEKRTEDYITGRFG